MINIEATLNGEDFSTVSIPKDQYSYSQLKSELKTKLTISTDKEIEIFDEQDNEIGRFPMVPTSSKKLQVALINKRYDDEIEGSANDEIVEEESKDVSSVIKDDISKNKYKCHYQTCRKTFKTSAKLFNHIKIHFKNKPYKCEQPGCGKSFLCKGQLRNHQSTHSDKKKFVCQYEGCDKSYSKKSRLVVHERSHTGERPFACHFEGCGKRFSEKGNLKTHIRTHTGEKPYFCSFKGCGKRFTTQGHLVDHERRHRDEKPFKCKICKKAFMRSSTVKVHMKTHEGDGKSRSVKSKTISENTSEYQEETKIRIPIEEEKVVFDQKPKVESPKKAYAVPYKKLQPNATPPAHDSRSSNLNIPKQTYSIIATITSSCDNVFDAACNNASQRYTSMMPQKKSSNLPSPPLMNLGKESPPKLSLNCNIENYNDRQRETGVKGSKSSTEKEDSHYSNTHIILPNLNEVNLEGCLVNKQASNFVERSQSTKSMALNFLCSKIIETDPLS